MEGEMDRSLSDPNVDTAGLSTPPNYPNPRPKRKREDDITAMLIDLETGLLGKFSSMLNSNQKELKEKLSEIQQSNINIETSIAFLNTQNEEYRKKFEKLENQREEDGQYITTLENKIEDLQIGARKTNIEIKNVPKKSLETKEDLIDMVMCLTQNIGCNFKKTDIKDIFRVRGKKEGVQNTPIVVETASTIIKTNILKSCKAFNIRQKTKLCAKHLGHRSSEDTPIFVAEHLTPRGSRLYFLARELIRSKKYKFCWTAYGKVYVRKEENSPIITVKSEHQHGRVKIRTTEEEKIRKEKERQEKLKIFKHAMKKIQEKRKHGELDKELLELTGKVLTSNPDIYTLWNIRREILTIFSINIEAAEEMSEIYDSELYLTECCLKINPKSYCAWHQREWVLMTRPNPDWKKELSLCNMYLKFDERNFHTWDYRRFVVSQCKPPLKEEFDFTTEKLYDNFSNYSAWHYRSKMLVELYPDLEGGRPIEDGHHKHELKMVESAAFTDPDDTSAWFYQRWLLGAVKTNINLVSCTVTPAKTMVAFSKHVEQEYVKSKTNLVINNIPVNGDWVSCTGNAYDVLWALKHNEVITNDMNIKVEYVTENDEKHLMPCKLYGQCKYIARNKIDFEMKYSEPVIEELNKQLESCRQLLALEPESKWTLLTTTFLLHCIDEKKYHNEVIEKLQTLNTIDKMRAGYYSDLLTKWNIEKQMVEDYDNEVLQFSIRFTEKITYLPHLQYYSYCENVDLSNQNLTSNILPSLVMLQYCKTLSLENNKLTTLKDFPELDLNELNLQGNEQLDKEEIQLFKKKCSYRIIF